MKIEKRTQVSKASTLPKHESVVNRSVPGMRIAQSKSSMKKQLLTSLALCLSFASLAAPTSFADSGGHEGGGNDIEAKFKEKELKLFTEVDQMSNEAKAQLKFEPSQVLANLYAPGRFEPLCASGKTLEFIAGKHKMAYVGAPGAPDNVIYLDCRPERDQEWQRLFKSSDEGDVLFLIHEAIRNNGIAADQTEDDYGVSSTYLKAKRIETKKMSNELLALLYPQGNNANGDMNCWVDIGEYDGALRISFYINPQHLRFGGWIAARSEPLPEGFGKSDGDVAIGRARILIGDTKFTKWVYDHYKRFHCSASKDNSIQAPVDPNAPLRGAIGVTNASLHDLRVTDLAGDKASLVPAGRDNSQAPTGAASSAQ